MAEKYTVHDYTVEEILNFIKLKFQKSSVLLFGKDGKYAI